MPPEPREPNPGIILVKSGITSTSLTPETFDKWYDEIHIPDVLSTPEISWAARYHHHHHRERPHEVQFGQGAGAVADADPSTPPADQLSQLPQSQDSSLARSPLPYLAVYRTDNLSWLHDPGCELWSVPLASALLPSRKETIFAWARFETEFWTRVAVDDDEYDHLERDENSDSEFCDNRERQDALILVQWEREREKERQRDGGGDGDDDDTNKIKAGSDEHSYCRKVVQQGFLSRLKGVTEVRAAQGPRFCIYRRDETGICPPALRGKAGTLPPEDSVRESGARIDYLALVSFLSFFFFFFFWFA